MTSEPQLPSADDILHMFWKQANGGRFFRAANQETLVGGKRVSKQKVPKLPESAATPIHQLKVTLYGSKPPIWRRLELPSTITPGRLHHVLQAAFTWDGYHRHVVETVRGEFGDPLQDDGCAERQDEETVTIAQVAAAEKTKIDPDALTDELSSLAESPILTAYSNAEARPASA